MGYFRSDDSCAEAAARNQIAVGGLFVATELTEMRKAKQIDLRTTPIKSSKKAWVLTTMALFAAAAIGTWTEMPKSKPSATISPSLVAKAPPLPIPGLER
jgi:hypothetical protein